MNCVNINDLPKMMRPNEQGFYGVQGVVSSNPTVPTNKIKGLQFNRCKPFLFTA